MISATRGGRRSNRRRSKPEELPALRRGREDRIVRWIGAAKRRFKKRADVAEAVALTDRIIRLRWADTFAEPVCVETVGTFAQVLLFRRQPNTIG